MERCKACSTALQRPYVECSECNTSKWLLCLDCFSRGIESSTHRSYHSYEVVKYDFSVLESGWTAEEELALLDSVAASGYGNWSDVARQMNGKSEMECMNHYQKFYLVEPFTPVRDRPLLSFDQFTFPIPFRVSEDPPRPVEGSSLHRDLAGYNAARGDFAVEHSDYAELLLNDICAGDDRDELLLRVKLGIIDVYRNVLKERHRRKKIIRRHGLINISKHLVFSRFCERFLHPSFVDSSRVFAQLLSGEAFDSILFALNYEHKLRRAIRKLQGYRDNGIRWLQSADVYEKQLSARTSEKHRHHLFADVLRFIQDDYQSKPWMQRKMVFDSLSKGISLNLPNPPRRTPPPINVNDLPLVDKLTARERELCSKVRIVPESYLEFKQRLISECNKLGYLRLAQARTLIKIDVNKTRKIFDFLVNEGLITNAMPASKLGSS